MVEDVYLSFAVTTGHEGHCWISDVKGGMGSKAMQVSTVFYSLLVMWMLGSVLRMRAQKEDFLVIGRMALLKTRASSWPLGLSMLL